MCSYLIILVLIHNTYPLKYCLMIKNKQVSKERRKEGRENQVELFKKMYDYKSYKKNHKISF